MSYLKQTLRKVAESTTGETLEGLEGRLAEAFDAHSPLVAAVLDHEGVDEELFLKGLAKEFDLPWWDNPYLTVSPELQAEIPVRLALKHHLVPVQKSENGLWLLTYDPFNLIARQQVAQSVQVKVFYMMSTRKDILHALRQGYGIGAETFDEILAGRAGDDVYNALADEVSKIGEEEDTDASIVKFVNKIIREAIYERATDIHFEPMDEELRIRIRIDGILNTVPVPPQIKLLQDSVISRLKIMSKMDIAERRLPQDGRINLEVDGERFDVRVATIPSVTGETVSLRLLGQEQFNLDKLGMESYNRSRIEKLLESPNGIILVTGPTGSGKSTTLYTLLSCLNDQKRRIITIEDPVENKIPGVIQIPVKEDINLTFSSGLRSILRGDPNVVMVGEIRDHDTAEIAIRSALTGHLVFSTLHTNDSIASITRLVDMGIEPFMLSTAVRAFIAQRLVRRLCDECKQEVEYPKEFLENHEFNTSENVKFFKAKGCQACRMTGYRGRTAIMEVCMITRRIQDMIIAKNSASDIRKAAYEEGMKSMRADGWEKVKKGITSVEEIIQATMLDSE